VKYLVLIAVVFVVIWLMRGTRRMEGDGAARRPSAPPPPQDMVECPVCHVHLPRAEALAGPGGQVYCCAEHSRRAGG
jgi:uncharacterized protein